MTLDEGTLLVFLACRKEQMERRLHLGEPPNQALRIFQHTTTSPDWILEGDVTFVSQFLGHKTGAEIGSDSQPDRIGPS